MLNKQKVVVDSDSAGLIILKSVLPFPYIPGPYLPPQPPLGVPSLVWLCIHKLFKHPDQLHVLNIRLHFRNELNDIDLYNTDPRLWATLVQIYDGLPQKFSTYTIPLSDAHLPLLQQIPCTPNFSLMTVLELPSCKALDDNNITRLKMLHSLIAFDASETCLTPYAFKSLARTLLLQEDEDAQRQHRGPWPLRVLSLRNCKLIDDQVFLHLAKFILLSVLDIRGTRCTRTNSLGLTSGGPPLLFYPTPVTDSLSYLQDLSPDIHSSPNPYTLHIEELCHHPTQAKPRSTVSPENLFVTLSATSSSITTGNADHTATMAEMKENAAKHRKNKETWYKRHERMNFIDRTESARQAMTSLPTASSSRAAYEDRSHDLNKRMSRPSWIETTAATRQSLHRVLDRQSSRIDLRQRHSDASIHVRAESTAASSLRSSTSTLRARIPRSPDRSRTTRDQSLDTRRLSTEHIHITEWPTAAVQIPVPEIHAESFYHNDKRVEKVRLPRSVVERAPTHADRSGSQFMLYRNPPPWSTLEDAISSMKFREMRRKADVMIATTARKTQLANVDRTGIQAVVAKQLGGLSMKRTRLDVSTQYNKPPPLPHGGSNNPFRKRQSDPVASNLLKPISSVKTPLFTQELLNTRAKENKNAAQTMLKRSASADSRKSAKQRGIRMADPVKKTPVFDWKKWEDGR